MLVILESDVVRCKKCKCVGKLSGAQEDFEGYYCPNCDNQVAIKEDGKILATEETFALMDCSLEGQ